MSHKLELVRVNYWNDCNLYSAAVDFSQVTNIHSNLDEDDKKFMKASVNKKQKMKDAGFKYSYSAV